VKALCEKFSEDHFQELVALKDQLKVLEREKKEIEVRIKR
jgi:predicted phage-related endonuclease